MLNTQVVSKGRDASCFPPVSQGAEVANTLVTSVLSVWPGCSDRYPEPVYFHLCSALLSRPYREGCLLEPASLLNPDGRIRSYFAGAVI